MVAPKTLLAHWEKELSVCGLASLTHEFYGTSQSARCEHPSAVMPCLSHKPRSIFLLNASSRAVYNNPTEYV